MSKGKACEGRKSEVEVCAKNKRKKSGCRLKKKVSRCLCQAKTKKGGQCKNNVFMDTKYCYAHSDKAGRSNV